jgi:hypothetical protein
LSGGLDFKSKAGMGISFAFLGFAPIVTIAVGIIILVLVWCGRDKGAAESYYNYLPTLLFFVSVTVMQILFVGVHAAATFCDRWVGILARVGTPIIVAVVLFVVTPILIIARKKGGMLWNYIKHSWYMPEPIFKHVEAVVEGTKVVEAKEKSDRKLEKQMRQTLLETDDD